MFFKLPASYDGTGPVSLAFVDAQGQLVRRFDLHLKAKTAVEKSDEQLDEETPAQRKLEREEKLTAVMPGMNRFQWNLRYADATEVTGFNPPVAAGGLEDLVDGPQVTPGNYRVLLDYGGQVQAQDFSVALDPRLHPAADALAARLALALQIHASLDSLDKTLNDAIAMRDGLQAAVKKGTLDGARAAKAIADLDAGIDGLVELGIVASEGDLLHETKLRDHLAYLAADIELAYDRPSAAEYAVFKELDDEANSGKQQLRAAMAAGKALLP